MKIMFEDKFKELKQKNKVVFNQAIQDHFKSQKAEIGLFDDHTIPEDALNSVELRQIND